MSDYCKLTVGVKYSENSDYSDPLLDNASWDPYELTPDEGEAYKVEADTGGTTVTTSKYSSVSLLIVHNTSTSNYVTAAFNTAAAGGAVSVRIAAGGYMVVTDFTAANNLSLTANSSACVCKVFVAGT